MQLKLENNEVIKLSEDDLPYTIVGESCSSYSYQGTKYFPPKYLFKVITVIITEE